MTFSTAISRFMPCCKTTRSCNSGEHERLLPEDPSSGSPPSTVDGVLGRQGSLTWRQILCLVCLTALRANITLNFMAYVFAGRKTEFKCLGPDFELENECPRNEVEQCPQLVFEEETLVAQYKLVCDR